MALRGGCDSAAKVRNIFDINIIYIGNFIEEGNKELNCLTKRGEGMNTNLTNDTNDFNDCENIENCEIREKSVY